MNRKPGPWGSRKEVNADKQCWKEVEQIARLRGGIALEANDSPEMAEAAGVGNR